MTGATCSFRRSSTAITRTRPNRKASSDHLRRAGAEPSLDAGGAVGAERVVHHRVGGDVAQCSGIHRQGGWQVRPISARVRGRTWSLDPLFPG